MHDRVSKVSLIAGLAVAAAMTGCATPRHTNTLIFATNTKFAIDVAQDPTGTPSLTIGYKRQEGVWMPLLANTYDAASGKLIPTTCTSDTCRTFVGSDQGAKGTYDTYSVLATFGGSASGSAQSVDGKATVAQYFATGLAARLLAQNGGAALVNTASPPARSNVSSVQATPQTLDTITTVRGDVKAVLDHVANADGSLDSAKLAALTTKATALSDLEKGYVNSHKKRADLEDFLFGNDDIATELKKALNTP